MSATFTSGGVRWRVSLQLSVQPGASELTAGLLFVTQDRDGGPPRLAPLTADEAAWLLEDREFRGVTKKQLAALFARATAVA